MLLPAARQAIVTTCQELSRSGHVVGTAGNVSVREGDLVAVTPSGLRYAELTAELVGVHRLPAPGDLRGPARGGRDRAHALRGRDGVVDPGG
jgi:ribulose-5-phosphate 4-epimerase/fuculose-1-phosphate aldolase